MSDQNIADRLKSLIENLGISNSQFADACNIARPTLSQLLTGRNKKVSDILIGQIHEAYPDLSVLWLLFGEGEVWISKATPLNNEGSMNIDVDVEKNVIDESGPANDSSILSRSTDIISKNACENREIHTNDREGVEYSKEKPLNTGYNATQPSVNKDVNAILKNAELLGDLAKIQKESKKVVQITIYFDDSTFETFYPAK